MSIPAKGELPFHFLEAGEVYSALQTTSRGLSDAEAESRLRNFGPNELPSGDRFAALKLLAHHCFNSITFILAIAVVLSFIVNDVASGIVVIVVIVLNIGIGYYQEYNSESAMAALQKLSAPTAQVLRNGGEVKTVPASELVVGDIVLLEEGGSVPADIRVIEAVNLEAEEAPLTGESVPVAKTVAPVPRDEHPGGDCPVGDRISMAFSGCVVSQGRGKGIVVKTGQHTEIGKIAASLANTKRGMTPLQKRMNLLAYSLLGIACLLAIPIFGANGWRGDSTTILYAVSLAVAILPEGLVAVITITLAYGMTAMAQKKVVVKKLHALETLGAVTNIVSDKTGTITEGKMMVRKIFVSALGEAFEVTGNAADPTKGDIVPLASLSDKNAAPAETRGPLDPSKLPSELREAVLIGALNNNATLNFDPEENIFKPAGDITEVSLVVLGKKVGLERGPLTDPSLPSAQFSFVAEYPFDSSIKRMSTVFKSKEENNLLVYSKGSMESMLTLSTHVAGPGGSLLPLDEGEKAKLLTIMDSIASQGLRVLGLASKRLPLDLESELSSKPMKETRGRVESGLTFIGLVGIQDPPRKETRPAVELCHRAGITVHMATGDHLATATAIAKQVNIIPNTPKTPFGLVMNAADFDKMDDKEVDALPTLPRVLARCSPQTKVKLVQALHRRNRRVAMTGDGVNDSPALKAADVGIAMGIGGSDVTKGVADMVLTNDDFGSIVKAVAEGRRVFNNLRKFVIHLLTGNMAEVVVLIIGLVFQSNDDYSLFPLSPVQILWLNMVTSSPPALGLGIEEAAPDIMDIPPRTQKEGMFNWETIVDILFYGTVMGGVSLGTYAVCLEASPFLDEGRNVNHKCNEFYKSECDDLFKARGACFASLSLLLLLHAYNCRDSRRSIFTCKLYDNRLLFWACLVGVFLIVPTFYIPGLNTEVLKHMELDWEWGPIVAGIVIFEVLVEFYKFLKRTYLPVPVPADVIKQSLAKFGSLVFHEASDVRDFDPGASALHIPQMVSHSTLKKAKSAKGGLTVDSLAALAGPSSSKASHNGAGSAYVAGP